MRMLVQSVVSLALLCSTPHFLSAQFVPRSANTWAYFSHIADGGGWQTTFTVSNPNRNPVSGSVAVNSYWTPCATILHAADCFIASQSRRTWLGVR